jgi:hypothetical protein
LETSAVVTKWCVMAMLSVYGRHEITVHLLSSGVLIFRLTCAVCWA